MTHIKRDSAKKYWGFTIIELMALAFAVAITLVIALSAFQNYRLRLKFSEALHTLPCKPPANNLAQAVEVFPESGLSGPCTESTAALSSAFVP